MKTLTVSLGDRSYDIVIGEGLLARAAAFVVPMLAQKRVIVVTDAHVAKHHLAPLTQSLEAAHIKTHTIILHPGEQTKSFASLEKLIDDILALQPERGTTLIALGGGVIGDLTGFAASITLRGMPFIQIPTTLLSQVDSSVGGKTGINTARGKNLVGSFYQPKLVLADTGTLKTLPPREMRSGYAEIVKYGLIDNPAFFAWLEQNAPALLAGDAVLLTEAIHTSCRAKAAIVAQDEKESGVRALLNLGHTFGHALEAECGFGNTQLAPLSRVGEAPAHSTGAYTAVREDASTDATNQSASGVELLHGEAVAIGMVMAFQLSQQLNLCPPADTARVKAHLVSGGLPTSPHQIRPHWDADRLLHHFHQDKKVSAGTLTFILARGIGKAFVSRDVTEADLRALLTKGI